jgi:hypothetical protein
MRVPGGRSAKEWRVLATWLEVVGSLWAEVYVFERLFKRLEVYRLVEGVADANNSGVWGMCGGDFHMPL